MKKSMGTSINERGAIIAVGTWMKVRLPDGREAVSFGDDLELRIVFTLAQGEAFLHEKEHEVTPDHLVKAHRDMSEARWIDREDAPSPVRLRGEAAILVFSQILTALMNKSFRISLAPEEGGVRFSTDNRPAGTSVPPVNPKDRTIH